MIAVVERNCSVQVPAAITLQNASWREKSADHCSELRKRGSCETRCHATRYLRRHGEGEAPGETCS